MKRFAHVVLAGVVSLSQTLACGGSAAPPAEAAAATGAPPGHELTPKPIPPELAQPAARAQQLGRLIHEKDIVSARGTDVFLANVGPNPEQVDPRPEGWVTARGDTGWTVTFARETNDSVQALFRIRMALASGPTEFERVSPPAAVDDRTAAMFRARKTAARAEFMACSKRYNTVVLPGDLLGQDGWLVYLLAATTEHGVMVAGGHHRLLITPDGRKIASQFAFTKSCLNIPPPEAPGDEVAGAIVSHLTSDTPTELHVFLSLLHRVPVHVVVMSRGEVWQVDGDRLTFFGVLE